MVKKTKHQQARFRHPQLSGDRFLGGGNNLLGPQKQPRLFQDLQGKAVFPTVVTEIKLVKKPRG
jgi:hypothetical protein